MSNRKKRLGKGLDAFFDNEPEIKTDEGEAVTEAEGIENIALEEIEPNPYQPREDFNEESLKELAASIAEKGVLQPLIIAPKEETGYYIVAGERRWRASQIAEQDTVPALVKDLKREEMIEIALIENIHRDDLNPLEEAKAYKNLLAEMKLTQQELAERIGKSRSTISNSLRLLKLPEELQEKIAAGQLYAGQARALAGLEEKSEQLEIAEEVISREMSVRETERYIAGLKETEEEREKSSPVMTEEQDSEEEEREISSAVSTQEQDDKAKAEKDVLSSEATEELAVEAEEDDILAGLQKLLGEPERDPDNLEELEDDIAELEEINKWQVYCQEIEEITGLPVTINKTEEETKVVFSCQKPQDLKALLAKLK